MMDSAKFNSYFIGQTVPQNHSTIALDLGVRGLVEVEQFMEKLTHCRLEDRIPDTLLLLSHPSSLALGARELNHSDLLMPLSYFENQGIYLYKNIRGGGLTYHWDGQVVCYPVLKLKPHEQNISNYLYRLEEVGLRALRDLGIAAERKREKSAQIGLWVGSNKIASIGIHVSRWVTRWGIALNLYGDKSPADFIRPCGLERVNLITVEQITGFKPLKRFVRERLVYHFGKIFEREVNFAFNMKSNNIKKRVETTNFKNY